MHIAGDRKTTESGITYGFPHKAPNIEILALVCNHILEQAIHAAPLKIIKKMDLPWASGCGTALYDARGTSRKNVEPQNTSKIELQNGRYENHKKKRFSRSIFGLTAKWLCCPCPNTRPPVPGYRLDRRKGTAAILKLTFVDRCTKLREKTIPGSHLKSIRRWL